MCPQIPTNDNNTTLARVEEGLAVDDYGRGYMGLSGIGYKCQLFAQFQFRSAFKNQISRRANRIFTTGHIAEEFIIADLKRIGIEVFRIDKEGDEVEMTGERGEEQEEIIGFAGHWKGHNDGRCRGVIEAPKTDHLLEMKTMNDKYFKLMVKNKLKEAQPKYYDQMQSYMGYLKLKRGFFVAYNKNDSSYYMERVRFDPDHFKYLQAKERIILEERPANRIGNPRTWFECKFCNARGLCLGVDQPGKHCRTCQFVDVLDNGVWECSKDNKELTKDEQFEGCERYRKSDFFKTISG